MHARLNLQARQVAHAVAMLASVGADRGILQGSQSLSGHKNTGRHMSLDTITVQCNQPESVR